MSEELEQLSGVYDMVVADVNLNIIFGSISSFAEYGYTLAEIIKVVDEDPEGKLAVKSYFIFTKNLNTQKLIRQKSKNVQLLMGLRLPRLRSVAMIKKLTGAGDGKSRNTRSDNKMVKAAGDANEDQRTQLMDLWFKYEDVFAASASQIGVSLLPTMDVVPIQDTEFKIPTPRPLGHGRAEFIKEKLDGMVEKGMAKKIQQAIYGSVVFAVRKKNNAWHMVLDLVAVNKVLHRDFNILPTLETHLFNITPARFYGCLDVVIEFYQIAITDRAKQCFNLMTTYGKFQLQFSPMGQLVWGICHKKLCPIIRKFNKLSYLLPFHPTTVQVYTDHLNLKAILQGGSKIDHGHLNRLQRWMVILQPVLVDIHHLDGDSNIFADMLTRWRRRQIVTAKRLRIMRKPLPQDNAPNLMKEVERQIRREYSEEEWRKLTEDYATRPSEVPLDVRDTNKELYIETDTYSTSEDEENTTVKIRSITVKVNHLRPKQQMDKKIYASFKSPDKYRVSVFNPYFEGDLAPLTEAEVIEAQKKEMNTRTPRVKRLSGRIILPTSILEQQLVHIHLANKHGSLKADLAEAAEFEWKIPAAMERTLRGDTPWKKMAELLRLFRDNCIHCRKLPKAIKTRYSLVIRTRRPRETIVADFLYVNRIGHILVLTDAFTRFTQLTNTKTPDIQEVIEALDRFATNYKLEKDFALVSDHASHFASSLMTALRKELRFSQSFAVSYASWTNGAVEVVNKKVLNFLKSLVSEYRLNKDE
eukprot:augustus_masked-scaffold_10-processed-gene-5.64-mRNA-1 protein AED:1.00 eAED:1.00 QI:363/0/0/0/1/1/6/0/753